MMVERVPCRSSRSSRKSRRSCAVEGVEPPVVDEQDVDARQLGQQAEIGSISVGQGELVEQPGGPPVQRPEPLATGLMSERAPDERLASAGRADEQQVLMLLDPAAGGELPHEGFVQLALGGIVDSFDAGLREFELGLLQGPGEPFVFSGAPLRLDEQGQALVEGHGDEVGLSLLLRPGRGQGPELEGVQLFEGRGGKHIEIILPYW